MKTKFIYESIDDILKPKSEKDIEKELSKLSKHDLNYLLLDAAAENKTTNIELIIKYGANVNCLTPGSIRDDRWTPLMYSSMNGNLESMIILIKYGANVNVKDVHGRTPLKLARSNGYIDAVNLLKQYGAK